MKERKIVGGFAGYQKAAREVFDANIHNPAIKYSPSKGFYVESALIPTDDGHVSLGEAYYNLNQNGARTEGGYSNYLEAKAKIIDELDGEDAGFEFRNKHSDVFFMDC